MQHRQVARLMNNELERIWKVATVAWFHVLSFCLEGLGKRMKHLDHDAWHPRYELGATPKWRMTATYSTGRSELQRQKRISWPSATTMDALNYHHACRFYSEWSSHALHTSHDTRHVNRSKSTIKTGIHKSRATRLCTVTPNIYGNSLVERASCLLSDVAPRCLGQLCSHELRYLRLSERWGFTLSSSGLWQRVAW
jgi:hypothetical protein